VRHFLLALKEGLVEHRTALLAIGGMVVAFVAVVQAISYVASSQAATCASCHIMEPYVEGWKHSTHADVKCVTCHTEWRFVLSTTYVKYALGAYTTRPRAEVPDERCLSCHEAQDLDTDEPFLKGIHFSHQGHLGEMRRGKSLHCTSCHSGHIVMGATDEAPLHSSVEESVCYTCHFKGAEAGQAATGCLVCHGPPSTVVTHQGFEFDHASYLQRDVRCELCHAEVIRGDANVPEERCATCHVSRIEAYEDTARVHTIHLRDHEIDCARCHNTMEHGNVAMAPALGERCDACHRPSHTGQEQMYIGIGGEGVPDAPSTMFLARVACDSCHGEPGGDPRKGAEELRRSCVTCHGQGYDRMVDDWIREIGALQLEVTDVVQRAEAGARAMGARGAEHAAALGRARHNLDFVRRARGEHNIHYAVELLRAARNDAAGVLKAAGAGVPAAPEVLSSASGYCRVCHSTSHLGTRLPFEHLEYDHNRHIRAGLTCDACHSLDTHGETTISLDGCMSCHHDGSSKRSCESCHESQASFYREGKLLGTGVAGDPDVMAAADVGCTDCHDLASGLPLVKSVQTACVGCHEEGFDGMLVDWVNEDQERVQALAVLVARAQRRISQEPGAMQPSHRAAAQRADAIYRELVRVKGVHNPALAGDAAAEATRLLSWVRE